MSDLGRKGLGDQAKEKITPDSQKSTLDQAGESLSGVGDRIAGTVQPEGQKSTTQKLGDSTRSGTDDASNQGKNVLESAQKGLSNVANTVSGSLSGDAKK